MKSAYPTFTPAEIQSFLEGRAVDMGSPGKDTVYGYGRLNLGAPPNPVVSDRKVYLPLMLKDLLPIPAAPVLNTIANADGDGNYTVSWNASANATGYLLQEDDNAAFSSPETRYSGAGTSWNATSKAAGTYHYRVQASNVWESSDWSEPQSVTVSSTQSTCPAAGAWVGTTNLGEDISFSVLSTPTCQVKPLKITVWVWTCGVPGTREEAVTWGGGFPIVDNRFTTGPAGTRGQK